MICLVVSLEQQSCHFGPLRADEQLSGPSLLVDLVLVSFQRKVQFQPVVNSSTACLISILGQELSSKQIPSGTEP